MKGFFRAGKCLCLPLLVVPQHSWGHAALAASAPAAWGCSARDAWKSSSAGSVHVERRFPEGQRYRGGKGPCARCHRPHGHPGDLLTLLLQQEAGHTRPLGWLRESSSTLMLFPAARGMFGGIKDGCGRVESNLRTTLGLAALRCSCLHAGGTTACSVALLERWQE